MYIEIMRNYIRMYVDIIKYIKYSLVANNFLNILYIHILNILIFQLNETSAKLT